MGLKWFRRWCGGRPRPFRGGGREVRRAGCGWDSRPENRPLLRRIHQPSKRHFSLRCPLFVMASIYVLRCGWWVGCGKILMCCWFVNGGFRGLGGNSYTLGYGFGSLWTGAGNWSAFSCEDDGVGGGCSDSSESFGGCAGEPEYCCGTGSTPTPTATAASPSDKARPTVRLAQQAARTTAQALQTGRGLKEGSKRFGEAAWGPLAKASGALWLELTGVFFGIFAVFAANGAWKTGRRCIRRG